MSGSLNWLFWLVGGSIAAFAAALLLWSLVWDRSRGRRRCPKCWYDMAGVAGLRCPECGRIAKAERQLRRTRRKRRWAAFGLVLLALGLGITELPRFMAKGWIGLVPSVVLVCITPADLEKQSAPSGSGGAPAYPRGVKDRLVFELWDRLNAETLATWEERVVLRRYLAAALPSLPGAIRVPDRWPSGEHIPVCFFDLPLNLVYASRNVDLNLRYHHGDQSELVNRNWSIQDFMPAPPEGAEALRFDVTLSTARASVSAPIEVPVRIGGDVATFLERLDTPEATTDVRNILGPQFFDLGDGDGDVDLVFLRFYETRSVGFEVAFTFRVVLDGQTLGTGADGVSGAVPRAEPWAVANVQWVEGGRAAAIAAGTRTEIIVTGDPEAAGRSYMEQPPWGRRPACWTGEFRAPLFLTEEKP